MLETIRAVERGQNKLHQFLRQSPGAASGARAGQIADCVRWLGGYLQAASILAQIPGSSTYEPLRDEQVDFCWAIWTRDPRDATALLGEVLARLGVAKLMEQVPGGIHKDRRVGAGVRRRRAGAGLPGISVRTRKRLERLTPRELVHVAVDCLDRLFIAPVSPGWERYRSPKWAMMTDSPRHFRNRKTGS